MDCPNCGLVNPETAQRCDCGYDFAAKTVKESYLTLSSTSPGRVTKEGGILIVPRGAVLPPYCVKCGIPTQAKRVKKTFSWHPPWIIVFVFLGLFPVIIALALTTKKIKVAVPLCPDHRKRRKKLQNIGLALLALSIPVGVSIGLAVGGPDDVGWSLCVSLLVCILALVVLLPMRSLLRPARIDDFGGRFQKASHAFLTRIPNTDQAATRRHSW